MGEPSQNPATGFLAAPRSGGPEVIVRTYAHYVLREAGAYCLPVRLDLIRSHFGLAVQVNHTLVEQRGFTTPDLRIYLNADDLPTVQNFTLAHEIVELLFLALNDGVADEWMDDQTFEALNESKERFCDVGAAELLLPMPLFAPLATKEPLSFEWARQVAQHCGVSLTATLWRVLETGLVNALFVMWSLRHSPKEYVPSSVGQLNLFGSAELMDPPRKMRVERVFRPPDLQGFVPTDKSVLLGGVIHRAYADHLPVEGWEELELGPVRGLYFVEAIPVSAGGETKVLTLIHLDGRPDPGRNKLED